MEKHLPLTAVIFEGVVVGVATVLFIRVGGLFQILVPSASLIIILAFVLQKQIRLITVSYLAALLLTFYSVHRIQEFNIVGGLTVIIIALELVTFVASTSFESLKHTISPIFLNGGFTFLGILLAFAYRIESCSPLFPEYALSSNLVNIISPICLTSFNKYFDANENIIPVGNLGEETSYYLFVARLVIDLLTWFPILSGALASLSETIRRHVGCSPLGWIVNYFKTTILGGLINGVTTLLISPFAKLSNAYFEDAFDVASPEQAFANTQVWLIILILIFVYVFYVSIVYGWASSYGSS